MAGGSEMPFMEALTRDGLLELLLLVPSCRCGGGGRLVLAPPLEEEDGADGLTMLDGFVGGLRFLPMMNVSFL